MSTAAPGAQQKTLGRGDNHAAQRGKTGGGPGGGAKEGRGTVNVDACLHVRQEAVRCRRLDLQDRGQVSS